MPAPTSPCFHIEESPQTGRRIHASVDIPANTPLLTTDALSTYVIFREYKREVCHWCFGYDGGRKLKVWEAKLGLAWCSDECKKLWIQHWGGEEVLDVWERVEEVMQRNIGKGHKNETGQVEDQNADANPNTNPPSEAVISQAWTDAEQQASLILASLDQTRPTTKASLHASQQASRAPLDTTTLHHLLSGILLATHHPPLWTSMLDLYATPTPYSTPTDLTNHISAYHHLLLALPFPSPVHTHINPRTLRAVPATDTPNSFGIRSLDDAGSEIFGYGVWPEASCWNHNCAPNVRKRRVGRSWRFETSRAVGRGEELCITYLGGDEEVLDVWGRRERLKRTWGFECACGRCVAEAGEGGE